MEAEILGALQNIKTVVLLFDLVALGVITGTLITICNILQRK